MQLSRLNTSEMIALSQNYLDVEHPAYQGLSSVPEVASLLPRLAEAHRVLVASQSADDLRASALQKEVAALVDEHEELARGLGSLCQGLRILSEEEPTRVRWRRLHELLLPAGRKLSPASYQAEGDNAVLLETILGGMPAQDKGLLKAQFVGKRSVFEIIERFIAVGKALGEKELERQAVPVSPSDGALLEARNQWTRTVGAIVAMLQMAQLLGELPGGLREHVLAPLSAATDRRPARRTIPPAAAAEPAAPSSDSTAESSSDS